MIDMLWALQDFITCGLLVDNILSENNTVSELGMSKLGNMMGASIGVM